MQHSTHRLKLPDRKHRVLRLVISVAPMTPEPIKLATTTLLGAECQA